jgi:hypothetical protein
MHKVNLELIGEYEDLLHSKNQTKEENALLAKKVTRLSSENSTIIQNNEMF